MSRQYYIFKTLVCHPNGLQLQLVSFLVYSNNAHQSIEQKGGRIFNNLKVQAGKPEVGFGGEELNKSF